MGQNAIKPKQRKRCYLPDDALLTLGSTVRTQTAAEAAVVTATSAVDTHIALLIVHVIVRQIIARVHRMVDIILGPAVAVRVAIGTIMLGA